MLLVSACVSVVSLATQILDHAVAVVKKRSDSDTQTGKIGALLKLESQVLSLVDDDGDSSSDEESSDSDASEQTLLNRRVEVLSQIDVDKTHEYLAHCRGAGTESHDEFKMKICVELAQCHFQLGNTKAALASLCVNCARSLLLSFSCFVC